MRQLVLIVAMVFTGWMGEARAQTQQCVASAAAGGTADAIAIPALPCALSTNLLILSVTASNVTTSPTLQPLGSPALPIVKFNGVALAAGDLQSGMKALLNSTGTSWVLLNPFTAATIIYPLTVGQGGTGDVALTAGLPILGAGTSPLVSGAKTGSTTEFATGNGTYVNGDCVSIDANGNLVDAGGPCTTGGGGGTVTSGTAGQFAYYQNSGTTVVGKTVALPIIANASGSASHTTGTIPGTSTALTLASAIDFVNGQGVRVNHAGLAFTKGQPSAATVTPGGVTGSTTYHYEIASVDGAGGVGAVIAPFSTASGNATLTQSNYNLLQWTNGSGALGAAIYRQISGVYTLIGLTNQTFFGDVGYTSFPFVDWLPSTAPSSSLADALVTTISSGGGTTGLTLAAPSTTPATSQGVYHDDGAAVLAAAAAGSSVSFPGGTFYIATASGITIPSNEKVSGEFGATLIQSAFLNGTIFTANGTQDLISGLNFNLVPGATGISSTGGSGGSISDIICNGGANGGGGTPLCVFLSGAAGMNLDKIALNGWAGSGQGQADGGMTPAIALEASSVADTLDHIILGNDGQVTVDMPSILVQDSGNITISNSILAADLDSPGGTSVQGLAGIEFQGSGQVLTIDNVQILGYNSDISMDTYNSNSPQTLHVVNSHLDFCGDYCISLNGGSWANIEDNSFVGEGNSPWDIVGNTGIYTSSSFTGGPNAVNGNTLNGFSGAGATGIKFSASMTNTTVCGNRYANNATNTSLGSAGSGSVYGCSTSP